MENKLLCLCKLSLDTNGYTRSLPGNHRWHQNLLFLVKITLGTMCNTFWLIIGLSVLRFSPISVNVINFLQAAINLFDTRVSPRSKIVFKFHDLNKTVTPPIFSISQLSTNPQNSYELLSLCKLCLDTRDRCQVTIDGIKT